MQEGTGRTTFAPGIDFITKEALVDDRFVDTLYDFRPGVITELTGRKYIKLSTIRQLAHTLGFELVPFADLAVGQAIDPLAGAKEKLEAKVEQILTQLEEAYAAGTEGTNLVHELPAGEPEGTVDSNSGWANYIAVNPVGETGSEVPTPTGTPGFVLPESRKNSYGPDRKHGGRPRKVQPEIVIGTPNSDVPSDDGAKAVL